VTVAYIRDEPRAKQLVREHNSHAGLVEACERLNQIEKNHAYDVDASVTRIADLQKQIDILDRTTIKDGGQVCEHIRDLSNRVLELEAWQKREALRDRPVEVEEDRRCGTCKHHGINDDKRCYYPVPFWAERDWYPFHDSGGECKCWEARP
jgi:hypothetical protein